MKRHPFDPVSFVFGAGLLALAAAVLAGEEARLLGTWLFPTIAIGIGVMLLAAGWQSQRTRGGASGDDATA